MAIPKAGQNQQTNRSNSDECMRRVRAMSEAAVGITSELSVDKVLQRVVDSARELLNARYAALGVVDEERQNLTAFIVSGVTRAEIEAMAQWPRGLGLLGLLIREPRPIRVKEIAKDSRSVGFPAHHPKMTSFLGVPIVSKGHVLGNFYMTDKIGAYEFSQEDEDLLVLFAANAAVAIENARLYKEINITLQEKIREVQRLAEVARGRAAELDAANKELEAFAYSVSHDLRAPLRHIDGFSQALVEDYADHLDDQGKEYIRFIREGTTTMAQLIDDMLTLSRVTRAELHREDVDLSAMAHQIANELRNDQPQRQVEFVIQPKVLANGDARLLHIVLENLLGNAWKFTSKRELARIEFGGFQQEGKSVYCVRDNGAGFDVRYVDKLFGAFQRLHRADEFPGTGVGLATVQRIIHRHGGRVWAEGEVDKGATFYFTL